MASEQSDGQRTVLVWAAGLSMEEKEGESASWSLGRFGGDNGRRRRDQKCHYGTVDQDEGQDKMVGDASWVTRQVHA